MTVFDANNTRLADAEWLAVQYVLGELPQDEAARFEERLAVDQDVREVLIEAVRLVEAMANVPAPSAATAPAARSRSKRLRYFAGAIASAAAVCVLGIAVFRIGGHEPQKVGQTNSSGEEVDPARLVVLWTESASSFGQGSDTEPTDEAGPPESPSSLLPPDWMLAAVEQEMLSAPSSDPIFETDDNTIERN